MKFSILIFWILGAPALGFGENPCEAPGSFVQPYNQYKLEMQSDTVGFVTHSSSYFDPRRSTKVGMNELVSKLHDQGHGVYYLHDANSTSNLFSAYLYEDCDPTQYLKSDIGHHSLNLTSVKKSYFAGGYYELCEHNTLKDALKQMVKPSKNLAKKTTIELVQVTNAIFAVGQDIRFSDPYYNAFKTLTTGIRRSHGKAVLSLKEILDLIGDNDLAIKYLKRRLRLMPMPAGWKVEIAYKGEIFPFRNPKSSRRIVFSFKDSSQI